MNGIVRTGCLMMLTLGFAGTAVADDWSFIETFDDQQNEGSWHFSGFDTWQPTGGNPGAYIRVAGLDTFAPQPRTLIGQSSIFTGNYREMNVTALGIDLITFAVTFSAGDRPLALILVSDNGTPGDFNDDWGAFYLHDQNVPLVGQGWRSYEFEVPSDARSLPPGWQFIQFGTASPEPDWNTLIENVSQVRFHYGDPTMFFIFQMWTLGMDNPRIAMDEREPTTPGDLNEDGVVDVFDLLILLGQWGECRNASDCPADLNNDGVVDVFDLLILLGNWG